MTAPAPTLPIPLLSITETARICGVSTKTIRRWIRKGDLIAVRLGAQWRIRPEDLDRFIRQHRTG